MDSQQELVQLMREQNELIKRYLWRLRFSLLGLLLLTTGIAIGLGVVTYQQRSQRNVPTPALFSVPTAIRGYAPIPLPASPAPVRIVTQRSVLPDGREVYEQRTVQDDPGTAVK